MKRVRYQENPSRTDGEKINNRSQGQWTALIINHWDTGGRLHCDLIKRPVTIIPDNQDIDNNRRSSYLVDAKEQKIRWVKHYHVAKEEIRFLQDHKHPMFNVARKGQSQICEPGHQHCWQKYHKSQFRGQTASICTPDTAMTRPNQTAI